MRFKGTDTKCHLRLRGGRLQCRREADLPRRSRMIVTVSVLLCIGCAACPDYDNVPEYIIEVRDTDTGELVCDAEVFVNSETAASTQSCEYRLEIPTSVTSAVISAQKAGYSPTSKEVSAIPKRDSCQRARSSNVKLTITKLP